MRFQVKISLIVGDILQPSQFIHPSLISFRTKQFRRLALWCPSQLLQFFDKEFLFFFSLCPVQYRDWFIQTEIQIFLAHRVGPGDVQRLSNYHSAHYAFTGFVDILVVWRLSQSQLVSSSEDGVLDIFQKQFAPYTIMTSMPLIYYNIRFRYREAAFIVIVGRSICGTIKDNRSNNNALDFGFEHF